jgi:hypothetical protein
VAEQLFKQYGYPTVIRQDDQLHTCGAGGSAAPSTFVSQGDIVTELVYNHSLLCAVIYVQAAKLHGSKPYVQFEKSLPSNSVGSVVPGQYQEWKRVGFSVPAGSSEVFGDEQMEAFLKSIPRGLNLQKPGALASVVHEMDAANPNSPETDANSPAKPAEAPTPPPASEAKPAKDTQPSGFSFDSIAKSFEWLTDSSMLFVIVITLAIAAALLFLILVVAKIRSPNSNAKGSLMSFQVLSPEDEKNVKKLTGMLDDFAHHGASQEELKKIMICAQNAYEEAVKRGTPGALTVAREVVRMEIERRALPA